MIDLRVAALARLCRQWGGSLLVLAVDDFERCMKNDEYSEAPFTSWHGINWSRREILAVDGRLDVGAVIHEMGHVFADIHFPGDEMSWLGWEIGTALSVGAYREWSRQNSNYSIDGDGTEWGMQTRSERRALVRDLLSNAFSNGLVDSNARPLCKRGLL